MTRRSVLAATLTGIAIVTASASLHVAPRLLWNETASVPVGLYRVQPGSALHVGDIAALRLPDRLALLLAQRGYLPFGVPLLKPVAALPGQNVCRTKSAISIGGAHVGDALASDHRGRPLPVWQGCHRLLPDEIFVMNPAEPRSLDGRYFGPLPAASVIGRAVPVWITTGRAEPHSYEMPSPVLLPPPLQ
ncbi:S26 family signal peptidase [Acidomonas methanolica]|uniref:Conjugal transfer protein TraF n=1 Tax=Acidomonas methanolica NBRC 104435 TaxID=1231351 RepID=A0A023D7I4_ACIMT|nr:S26 family signal peptidase [Acidomonas methanolica]TCS19091.1 conjugation peptidase TraF [Acidomonas methanolica]GAJ30142.1 conjugal transfer protein TraF [Acidomonas methanolica NBRC 104435]GBQ48492.1 conjugal transfer protein precursor [Acidomonas methanolica]GEL00699.1 peptidase S26 [Acidomonas methanolica NBRC 104435]